MNTHKIPLIRILITEMSMQDNCVEILFYMCPSTVHMIDIDKTDYFLSLSMTIHGYSQNFTVPNINIYNIYHSILLLNLSDKNILNIVFCRQGKQSLSEATSLFVYI